MAVPPILACTTTSCGRIASPPHSRTTAGATDIIGMAKQADILEEDTQHEEEERANSRYKKIGGVGSPSTFFQT